MEIDVKISPPEAVRPLVSLSLLAPSADNYQPWHCTWDGVKLVTRYDAERVGGRTFAALDPATLIVMGAVIENFSSIAAECEFDLETELATEQSATEAWAVTQFDDIVIPSSYYGDNPIIQRHTNRFDYQKVPVSVDTLTRLSEMRQGAARVVSYNSPKQKTKIADIAENASTVRFRTREVHEWLGASLRFTQEDVDRADGLDVRTLNLPPGGAIFLKITRDWERMSMLNKIGMYRFMAKVDSAPLRKAPAIIGICGPATRLGAIQAGMLLNRAWKYLNSHGVAAHPYYVVSDQLTRASEGKVPLSMVGQVEEIGHHCRGVFELSDGETVHMLMRIGYPKRDPIRSRRLSLETVFTDLTGDC